MEDRKAFKFYRSYYEIASELSDKDRLAFFDAILQRQFLGTEKELTGMAKFAYISQRHSIDTQIKGYCDKMEIELPENKQVEYPTQGGTEGGVRGGCVAPSLEEKEKEKEKEKEEVKEELRKNVSKNKILSKTELDNQLLESYTQSEINVAYLCLDWIADNTPTLNKMKSPLKVQEALKLIEQFGKELLKTKLYAMENWTKILTKKSTYLTALDWLKQEGTTAKPQLTLQQKREAEEVAGCRYFRKIEEKDMLPENPFKYTKVSDMITTKLPEINSIEQLNETLKNIIK